MEDSTNLESGGLGDVIKRLQRERALIEEAIAVFERLDGISRAVMGEPKKRGRPPGAKNKPKAEPLGDEVI